MALIDMLTDIKSFNYKKVGQKHDEYFGEDAATGFTPNRETGDKTEFINKDSVFGPGGNVNFFKDKNATGFTENRNTKNPSEYIEGSGNDFNFKNKTNTVDYFLNKNQTGFTHDRFNVGGDDIGNTEFIIGSGNGFNFSEKTGFQTFGDRPFSIDRNPGNRFAEGAVIPDTELPDGGGSLYSKAPKLFHLAGSGTDFFTNKMVGDGFVVRKDEQLGQSDFYGANTPGYINFNNPSMTLPKIHIGKSFIPNVNATGFTTKRTEKDLGPVGGGFVEVEPGGTAGEYIIGSGLLDLDGSPITGPTNYFPNSFGVGFIPNAQELYNANEINPAGGAGRSMFNLETVVENPGAADGAQVKFQLAIGNVRTARTNVELQAQGSREVPLSSIPNIPFSYQFSDIHPYGEASNRLALTDRLGEVDDEYKKFGGNAGLRASTPGNSGNANEGILGFDEPFITKEIGENGYSELSKFDAGIFRGGIPLNALRLVDDALRLGSWTLTAKGIIWNAKQFILQAMNARGENRIFNPAGVLGSIAPMVHLPRHTDGSFTDFREPPTYPNNDISDDITTIKDDDGFLKKPLRRLGKAIGIVPPGSGQVEQYKRRIVLNEPDKGDPDPFLGALGLSSTAFSDPKWHTRSGYGPQKKADGSQGLIKDKTEGFVNVMDGSDTGDLTTVEQRSPYLITAYNSLKDFNRSPQRGGQSFVKDSDTPIPVGMTVSIEDDHQYETVANTEITNFKSVKITKDAKDFNLGKGLIRSGPDGKDLYNVGVSNKLQVPYHGEFNNLNGSLADKTKIPDDFIKFRIREAVNGKWLIFPAHLGTITDTVTPEWSKERYIGRPDQTHIYTGASRNVSFDFKVAAFTKQEIPIIQEKMNYLVGLAWPTYKSDDTPTSPYVYLTIGDMFNNTPGYFESITLTVEENAVWEIDDGHQIPQFFNVSLTFVHVGKYLPTTIGKHYEVPWLKDHGAGASSHGTFDKDPRDGSTSRPAIQGTQEWTKTLPI